MKILSKILTRTIVLSLFTIAVCMLFKNNEISNQIAFVAFILLVVCILIYFSFGIYFLIKDLKK